MIASPLAHIAAYTVKHGTVATPVAPVELIAPASKPEPTKLAILVYFVGMQVGSNAPMFSRDHHVMRFDMAPGWSKDEALAAAEFDRIELAATEEKNAYLTRMDVAPKAGGLPCARVMFPGAVHRDTIQIGWAAGFDPTEFAAEEQKAA